MSKTLTLAALQTHYGMDLEDNIARTVDLVRQAAAAGAQVILPSELFQGPYFCVTQEERWFATAKPWREHPCVKALAPLAGEPKDPETDTPAEDVAVQLAAEGEPLKVTIPGGAPVEYIRTEPRRAAFASYTGYMAELDAARSSLRAWAVTHGYEVTDRPYEIWKAGVDKSFTAEGTYDIYWAIK